MKNKILLYVAVFFLILILFSQITQIFTGIEISKLKPVQGKIENFTLVGVNSDRYILKGKSMLELQNRILIDNFNLKYIKNNETIFINSEQATYHKRKNFLDLFKNVKITTGKMKLYTDKLRILVNERRAYNTTKVKLVSDNMETLGENIFINLKQENMKLENVKTIYRGS
ncbi:LPS export ABC transporter periplasmic protein LptC [Persephonella sp.]|uniref:LPS export ABC transporter periplasmic protein LptC n=1 Tax=Persephonella sp. TaxID=2060922 RepID=UPI0026025529|nr:LPS export ABC transporter periplasmic protein LptC [Persephonella sp.]